MFGLIAQKMSCTDPAPTCTDPGAGGSNLLKKCAIFTCTDPCTDLHRPRCRCTRPISPKPAPNLHRPPHAPPLKGGAGSVQFWLGRRCSASNYEIKVGAGEGQATY